MDWRKFLTISTQYLSVPIHSEEYGEGGVAGVRSWCAWTTFSRLSADAGYWTGSFPEVSELGERGVADGGTWGQPIRYDYLAHFIIPRQFIEEYPGTSADFITWSQFHEEVAERKRKGFWMWKHTQDIDGLSELLHHEGIEHRLSQWALEVKLY